MDSSDSIRGQVTLEPTVSPNGAYAYYEDDELVLGFGPSNPKIDGDGVNPGTVTPFHRVFNITNTDDEPGRVWLTANTDAVTFYNDTNPDDSLTGEANAVELGPGETLTVGVLVDATDEDVEATTEFTLHAEPVNTGESSGEDDGADLQFFGSEDSDESDGASTTATPTPAPTATPTATPSPTPGSGTDAPSDGTPTATPTTTPTPTETGSTPDAVSPGESGGDGEANTPTDTPRQSVGGFDPGLLLLLLAVIGAVLLAASVRRAQGE